MGAASRAQPVLRLRGSPVLGSTRELHPRFSSSWCRLGDCESGIPGEGEKLLDLIDGDQPVAGCSALVLELDDLVTDSRVELARSAKVLAANKRNRTQRSL
jgi:hypothetical protein